MHTIETYVPITQAKAKLLDIVRQLSDTNDTIAITNNGVPEAVMLSMKKFEGFLETIDILADPEILKQLRGSAADIKEGKLIDLDEQVVIMVSVTSAVSLPSACPNPIFII
jgi:prevent-host-death family protein